MLVIPEGLNKFPVSVQFSNITEYPWHYHLDLQILWVLEGEIELKITYGNCHLSSGDIQVIHTEDVHGIKSISSSNKILFVNFSLPFFSKTFPNLYNEIFIIQRSPKNTPSHTHEVDLKSHLSGIVKEFSFKEPFYEDRILEISVELIKELRENFSGYTLNRDSRLFAYKATHDCFQTERIRRIISKIYYEYPFNLTLSTIAEEENINNHYLSHLFYQFIGTNFRDFLSMVRVEMSEKILLESNLSVSKIAHQVGFSQSRYFNNHFKHWFICSPKSYREKFTKETIINKSPVIEALPLSIAVENTNPYIRELQLYTDSVLRPINMNFNSEEKPIADNDLFSKSTILIDYQSLISNNLIRHDFNTFCKHIQLSNRYPVLKSVNPSPQSFNKKNFALGELYFNTQSQAQCISYLKSFVDNPKEKLPTLRFIDTIKHKNGLLTLNGLKKPFYHLFLMICNLHPTIVFLEPDYIITKLNNSYSILLFNVQDEIKAEYNLDISDIPESYQITEKKLVATDSCIDFWCQLNFQDPITEADFSAINTMSRPKVSFEIIPAGPTYKYNTVLDPNDISLLIITPLSACTTKY